MFSFQILFSFIFFSRSGWRKKQQQQQQQWQRRQLMAQPKLSAHFLLLAGISPRNVSVVSSGVFKLNAWHMNIWVCVYVCVCEGNKFSAEIYSFALGFFVFVFIRSFTHTLSRFLVCLSWVGEENRARCSVNFPISSFCGVANQILGN